ncbi:MAG: cobalamin biosynthesis protein CbiM, partial [Clostridia bacterium]
TSVQLGFAHPAQVGGVGASIIKFMGIFAVTQIPLAVIEGIVSAIVILMLENFAKPELTELGYFEGGLAK